MPPRKRARHSAATARNSTTPQRDTQPKSETPPAVLPARYAEYTEALSNAQSDPWTDEEETLLFKSLVKWKPTGLHKHFRMLSIFESFRAHGYIASSRGPPAHLRIPGIWAKLYTLYDLDALDQRENAHAGVSGDTSSNDSDEEDEAEAAGEDEEEAMFPRDFELPQEEGDVEFGEMIWRARLAGGVDEVFDGPEIIKGLSSTRSLPGAKLQGEEGMEAEDAEESGEQKDMSGEESGEEESAEEEAEEEEDEMDEDEAEEQEDSGEDEEDEEEQEPAKPAKKIAKTPAKRGQPKTTKTQPAPKRRAPRRGR